MGPNSLTSVAAMARLAELVHHSRDTWDLEERLAELAECAREAAGGTSAWVERYDGLFLSPGPAPGDVESSRVRVPVRTAEAGTVHADLVVDGVRTSSVEPVLHGILALCAALVSDTLRASRRLEARTREEALDHAVHTVVAASVRHLELDEMLIDAIDALRRGVRCQGAWIRVFDSPDPAASPRHAASYPEWADSLASEELRDISGRAARICWERQVVSSMHLDQPDIEALTTDAERDYMFAFMRSIEARSMLMAPLGGGGQCQGFIALTRTTVQEPFDALDEAAVMSIGREVGNAVVHARLFERQRLMVSELQRLHDYKDRFVATVAHQLKTPLTSIVGHVEVLEEVMGDGDSQDVQPPRDSLIVIARSAHRIRDTIDSLLTLSKAQDVDRVLSPTPVRLIEVVGECCDVLTTQSDERGVSIDRSAVADSAVVLGDLQEVEELVDNVLGNAVKYSRRGGVVAVTAARDRDEVLLVVRDDGIGISASELPRLFEPFHRSTDPSSLAIAGTGLGMAIVKAVVDRHHGRIEVDSHLGTGTTVRVWLPAAPESRRSS